tara:strand:+ start:1027 stop:1365 length:339 start_codon:yes stop_codon:yes gene_type:complete
MAVLSTNVKLYLEANGKVYETERDSGAFLLRNDRDERGDYIHTWNVSGLAEPSAEQLSALDSEGGTHETNERVRGTRKKAYGDIGEQLDEIFKDIDAWKTRIQTIKNSNPKS